VISLLLHQLRLEPVTKLPEQKPQREPNIARRINATVFESQPLDERQVYDTLNASTFPFSSLESRDESGRVAAVCASIF